MHRALAACVASLALAACADQTGILVQISSTDLAVPSDIDGLTIRAHTPDGLMSSQTSAIRTSWPQSLLIRPASGEALGEVRVEVTGTLGGAFVVRRAVTTAFAAGQVRRVDVQLTRDCVHVMCADSIDCVAGVCQGAVAMPDSGVADSGAADAGAIDAGPGDAGPHDAGNDVGLDGGSDAGTDAGSDAGSDANTPCSSASCLGRVVISEMSPAGTNEFIELYNRSGQSADLGGCTIQYAAGGAAFTTHATLAAGTTIPSHGYYLLTHPGYVGPPASDQGIGASGFLDADAAVALQCGAIVIDLLGYGAGATHRETSPVAPAFNTTTMPLASYERKALMGSTATSMAPGGSDATAGNSEDSDDNSADFVTRTTRDPQSSASPHEP